MYLVARPYLQAQELIQQLTELDIAAQYLPLIEVQTMVPNWPRWQQQLEWADCILAVSPTAIKLAQPLWTKVSPTQRLCTPGAASARVLANYINSGQICFPKQQSGIVAALNEGVLVNCQRVVVIGGVSINPHLVEFCQRQAINLQQITLYQHYNLGLEQMVEIEKIICHSPRVGIIITSQIASRYLFECQQLSSTLTRVLQASVFISSHSQITSELGAAGVTKVYQSATSDNLAIINLIRKIEYERNH